MKDKPQPFLTCLELDLALNSVYLYSIVWASIFHKSQPKKKTATKKCKQNKSYIYNYVDIQCCPYI